MYRSIAPWIKNTYRYLTCGTGRLIFTGETYKSISRSMCLLPHLIAVASTRAQRTHIAMMIFAQWKTHHFLINTDDSTIYIEMLLMQIETESSSSAGPAPFFHFTALICNLRDIREERDVRWGLTYRKTRLLSLPPGLRIFCTYFPVIWTINRTMWIGVKNVFNLCNTR